MLRRKPPQESSDTHPQPRDGSEPEHDEAATQRTRTRGRSKKEGTYAQRVRDKNPVSLDEIEDILNPPDTAKSRIKSVLAWTIPTLSAAIALALIGLTVYLGASPPAIPTLGTSMQPNLHQGDLAILKYVDPTELKIGDAIAYRTTDEQQAIYGVPGIVLHRIIEINEGRQGLVFTTQGDNNPEPDPYKAAEANIIGQWIASIDNGGLPLLIFTGPYGRYILIGGGSLIAIYITLGFIERASARTRARDELTLRLARALEKLPEPPASPSADASAKDR